MQLSPAFMTFSFCFTSAVGSSTGKTPNSHLSHGSSINKTALTSILRQGRMLQHAAFDSEGLVCFVLASPPSPLSQHLVCVPRTIMARQTPIFFRNKTK